MFNLRKKTEEKKTKQSWVGRLKQGLSKTQRQITHGLDDFLFGKKIIDADILEQLEAQLLQADIGVATTNGVLNAIREASKRDELHSRAALEALLADYLLQKIKNAEQMMPVTTAHPFIVLAVGVNGAGKTTTIAKMAHYYKSQQQKIMLAAGDTFRAAAINQLKIWGERNDVPVIAQHDGADSAAVIFDATQAAMSRDIDILFADTAGRLHTQNHLMDELKKIKRVMSKLNEKAPHETMLVLDASMGQNALQQAKLFHEHLTLNSISLTKLDGTAKGGIIFSIYHELQLPIRFIGIGEQLDDLQPFKAHEFINALFAPSA